jgi:hypothetical protein
MKSARSIITATDAMERAISGIITQPPRCSRSSPLWSESGSIIKANPNKKHGPATGAKACKYLSIPFFEKLCIHPPHALWPCGVEQLLRRVARRQSHALHPPALAQLLKY